MNDFELLRVTEYLERARRPYRALFPMADEDAVQDGNPKWLATNGVAGSVRLVRVGGLADPTGRRTARLLSDGPSRFRRLRSQRRRTSR